MTSDTWIVLKDASWMSVIVLIGVATLALAFVMKKPARVVATTPPVSKRKNERQA